MKTAELTARLLLIGLGMCASLIYAGDISAPGDSAEIRLPETASPGSLEDAAANRSPSDITALPENPAGVSKYRIYLATGMVLTGTAITYAIHIQPWWSGEKQGFRFKFDWYNNYWLEVDKFGHFFANIQVTRLTARVYRWAGVKRKTSLWLGALNSTLLYTSFELTDAGFADWGFSVPDYVANLLGAGYPLLQEYVPVFRRFNFKFSYRSSQYYQNQSAGVRPGFVRYEPYEYLIGDYDGFRFWLSAEVNWLLPEQARKWWPDWLNLAAGYGAENLPQGNPTLKMRVYYLALDYNFDHILPGNSGLMQDIKGILNTIHFPAPTLRFDRQGTKFYLMFF